MTRHWISDSIRFFLVLGVPLLISAAPAIAGQDTKLKNAVVKIFANANPPDFLRPWQSKGITRSIGSGCIISGNRVLTSAHVVSHQTFIRLRKNTGSKRYTAKVEAVAHDCDLAVLTVEDPEFFERTVPVPFGGLPMLQDTVTVMGYPVGGDQLSVTEGVVSRVDMIRYSHSHLVMLGAQIDAAINPGNSGGPVIQNGRLVGIAFQGLQDAENVGYMVPTPIIEHFFKDLEDDHYDGIPWLDDVSMPAENPALRQFHDIRERGKGVLVTNVIPLSPVYGYLEDGDILLELDGVPIADDGTFEFRTNERLPYSHLVDIKQIGSSINLKVKRKGELRDLSIELKPYVPLVPWPSYFNEPSYFIHGGFVFTILSGDLLLAAEELLKRGDGMLRIRDFIDLNYYALGAGRFRHKAREEIVVLLNVLPDAMNIGYQDIRGEAVAAVNGELMKSFKQFVMALHKQKGDYIVIDTEQESRIILDSEKVEAANKRILEKYGIASAYSQDVEEWIG